MMKYGLLLITALTLFTILSLYLPTGLAQETGMSDELHALVETERAFARTSEAKGMKEAFLSYAADDGVLFRRTVVNAKELWGQTDPAPTGLLMWHPAFADIAGGGDMGYTFGPWEFRTKPTDKEAAGHGHFVTVWRKQADGSWKFELDIGISHPAPPSAAAKYVGYPPAHKKVKGNPKSKADAEAARKELLDAERELAKDAAAKGAGETLLDRADEQIRFFRPNAFPVTGKMAVRDALKGQPAILTWHTDKTGAARSGDLGYAYGTYEVKEKTTDATPSEQGHYVRIWKRQPDGKWRVVLDITNPVRPAA